jgi:hypothetical protein
MPSISRRQYLASAGYAALATIAGCQTTSCTPNKPDVARWPQARSTAWNTNAVPDQPTLKTGGDYWTTTLGDDVDLTGLVASKDTVVVVGYTLDEQNGILTTVQLDDGKSDTTYELNRRPTGPPALVDSIAVTPVLGDVTEPSTGGLVALSTAGCLGGGGAGDGETDGGSGVPSDDGGDVEYAVERVADGFENAWGIAFLPGDGRLLVTERPGRLSILDPADGARTTVEGVPDVHAAGQGGLLDVAVHPEFPGDARVYLTYAATDDDGESATHVGSGRLSLDGDEGAPALDGFEPIRVATPFLDSDQHFGSRATFGPDGALFVTVGDRRAPDFGPDHASQDRSNELGSTLPLTPHADAHPG